jgi:hypothetical protein
MVDPVHPVQAVRECRRQVRSHACVEIQAACFGELQRDGGVEQLVDAGDEKRSVRPQRRAVGRFTHRTCPAKRTVAGLHRHDRLLDRRVGYQAVQEVLQALGDRSGKIGHRLQTREGSLPRRMVP